MSALVIIGVGYPLFLALLVLLDWRTGWAIADAFGKDVPQDMQ